MIAQRSARLLICGGPLVAVALIKGLGALPPPVLEIPKTEVSALLETPVQALFQHLHRDGAIVVNGACESSSLCVTVLEATTSADGGGDHPDFREEIEESGALAVPPNRIYIGGRFAKGLLVQAATDLQGHSEFLKNLDFSEPGNLVVASKATGIPKTEILEMASGKRAMSEKLSDYINAIDGNHRALADVDRTELQQLLIAEASQQISELEPKAWQTTVRTIRAQGYPENVQLTLGWILLHEYKHLDQFKQDGFSLRKILPWGRKELEAEADDFASDEMRKLLSKLKDRAIQSPVLASAWQASARAARKFWITRTLTKTVAEFTRIPLSRLLYLVQSQDCISPTPLADRRIPGPSANYFDVASRSQVYRFRSTIMSDEEFVNLHELLNKRLASSAHEFDWYRGQQGDEDYLLDERGAKLWKNEIADWGFAKAILNGSRAFLPIDPMSAAATPFSSDLMMAMIRKSDASLEQHWAANWCPAVCRLWKKTTTSEAIRIELMTDKTGKLVQEMKAFASVDPALIGPSNAERMMFELAAEILSYGPTIIGGNRQTTLRYVKSEFLAQEFSEIAREQATCSSVSRNYPDGSTILRIQRSDGIHFQMQFFSANGSIEEERQEEEVLPKIE